MATLSQRTVCVNKVDALVDKHRHVIFSQLLVSQLCAVRVRFVFYHQTPYFCFPWWIHNEIARIRRAVDKHCWAFLNEQVLCRVIAVFQTNTTCFSQVKNYQARFSVIIKEKFSSWQHQPRAWPWRWNRLLFLKENLISLIKSSKSKTTFM